MGDSVSLCAVTLGIGKDVKITHVQFLQESVSFPELVFPLAGETDDDIHANIEIWDPMDQSLDEVGEKVPIVVAVHSPENVIITALQRNVEMAA